MRRLRHGPRQGPGADGRGHTGLWQEPYVAVARPVFPDVGARKARRLAITARPCSAPPTPRAASRHSRKAALASENSGGSLVQRAATPQEEGVPWSPPL